MTITTVADLQATLAEIDALASLTVAQRVENGVSKLDAHPGADPDWALHIDPDKLDLSRDTHCLISLIEQAGSFNRSPLSGNAEEMMRCGFVAIPPQHGSSRVKGDEYRDLTREWQKVIGDRQLQPA